VLRDMASRIMLRKKDAYHQGGAIDRDAAAQALIGTGPYKVTAFEPGQELVLERVDDFFGEKPAISKVVVRNLPDIGTQQAELMSGGIDWMFKVPLDLAESLGATPMAEFLIGGSAAPIHTACHPAQFGCAQGVQDYPYDPDKAEAASVHQEKSRRRYRDIRRGTHCAPCRHPKGRALARCSDRAGHTFVCDPR
jgi:peptide/nickel transport system substrate-binding protein